MRSVDGRRRTHLGCESADASELLNGRQPRPEPLDGRLDVPVDECHAEAEPFGGLDAASMSAPGFTSNLSPIRDWTYDSIQ